MPTKVYWLDEPKILVAEYSGEISGDDIDKVMGECVKIVTQHSCHFLVDILQITSLPKDILRMGSLMNFVNHPNRGWLVFAGHQNVMVKFAAQVLVRNKFRFSSSREEAVSFLQDLVRREAQEQSAVETTN